MAGQLPAPDDRRYTEDHLWIKGEGDIYQVGITAFAQDQLGDIVYVELPSVGARVTAGHSFGVIESVKTASDLEAPVDGEVLEVNGALTDEPQIVNDDPYERGWLIRMRADDPASVDRLMSAQAYQEQVGG